MGNEALPLIVRRRRVAGLARRTRRLIGVVAAVIVALLAAGRLWGFRLNYSASVPRGLYQAVGRPPAVGDLVLVCLPRGLAEEGLRAGHLGARAYSACPGGVHPLLKIVAALEGDVVVVEERGLIVNGRRVLGWQRLWGEAVPLPRRVRIPRGSVWLTGVHPGSWDSRYFGPVPLGRTAQTMRPVWVVEEGALAVFEPAGRAVG